MNPIKPIHIPIPLATLTLLALLILAPLYILLRDSLSPDAWTSLSTRQLTLIAKSLLITLASSLIATLLALPCALYLSAKPLRKTLYITACLSLPLFIPPYVLAVAWVDILGSNGFLTHMLNTSQGLATTLGFYSPLGVALVQALSYWPIALLAILIPLRRIPPEILDAARLTTNTTRLLLRIMLPLLLPGILLGFLLIALVTWTSFAVPSLLQTQVYTVEIYTAFNLHYNPALAFTQSLPLAGIACFFILGIGLLSRKNTFKLAAFPDHHYKTFFPRHINALLLLFIVILALSGSILPLAMLLKRATPLHALPESLTANLNEILQSSQLALPTATLILLIALLINFLLPKRMTTPIALLSLLPYLFTGPVWAIALIGLWNHPGLPGQLYDSPTILILALTARYLWIGILGLALINTFRPRTLEEAARLSGATAWQTFTRITLPLIAPHLFLLWATVFILTWGDLDSIVLLAPPGWAPLPLRLFTLMHYGPSRDVASLSLFSMLFCMLWVLIAFGGIQLLARHRKK